ncbi:uncharacterized protein LOC144756156 isoform X2 [Lissotriton helveticus]
MVSKFSQRGYTDHHSQMVGDPSHRLTWIVSGTQKPLTNMNAEETHAFNVAKERWVHIRRVKKGYRAMERTYAAARKDGTWRSMPEIVGDKTKAKGSKAAGKAGRVRNTKTVASPVPIQTTAAIPGTSSQGPGQAAPSQGPALTTTSQDLGAPTTTPPMADTLNKILIELARNNNLLLDLRNDYITLSRRVNEIGQKLGIP